jgi:hypothetical protein
MVADLPERVNGLNVYGDPFACKVQPWFAADLNDVLIAILP